MQPTSPKFVLGTAVAGLIALGGFGLANAASNDTGVAVPAAVVPAASTDADADTDTITDTGTDPAVDLPAHDETPLTGDVADQVTAAALQAVPGGTVERVETDADGAVYEAHMIDADGNPVTVTFDADLNVIETRTGGPGGDDRHGRGDHADEGSADETSDD